MTLTTSPRNRLSIGEPVAEMNCQCCNSKKQRIQKTCVFCKFSCWWKKVMSCWSKVNMGLPGLTKVIWAFFPTCPTMVVSLTTWSRETEKEKSHWMSFSATAVEVPLRTLDRVSARFHEIDFLVLKIIQVLMNTLLESTELLLRHWLCFRTRYLNVLEFVSRLHSNSVRNWPLTKID